MVKQDELNVLQQRTKQLTEELNSTKSSNQTLKHRLEEMDRENKVLTCTYTPQSVSIFLTNLLFTGNGH